MHHEENGLLTATAAEATARHLRPFKNDPELCRRRGNNARQDAAAYYSWHRVAREAEAVFTDAMIPGCRRHFFQVCRT